MTMYNKVMVPYGIGDFAQLKEGGGYYVDKTRYIYSLEQYKAPVFLRPRRFGKSLMCSTLYYYYAREQASRFESLFGDTFIGKHPTPHHNTKLVLRYNFSEMKMGGDLSDLEHTFNNIFAQCTDKCVQNNRDLFGDFNLTKQSAQERLSELIQYVDRYNLPQIYIIIDEYDNFTNQLITGGKDQLYEMLTTRDSFLRNFFKVIKKGCDEGTVFSCYITGVLPVTIDDLTSGYNIAKPLTLHPEFYGMLGFTHDEAKEYLCRILDDYFGGQELFDEVWKVMKDNYDSYMFAINGQPLFNSSIVTNFLQDLAYTGKMPRELFDVNLRTDVNWIKRLARTNERANAVMDSLLLGDGMPYQEGDLSATFNLERFLDPQFFPVSLFFLGLVTIKDEFTMVLPNLCVKGLFMGYYNTIHEIKQPADRYVGYFRQFAQDGKLEPLIEGICHEYLGDLPAQVFDRVNENFVRCAVYNTLKDYLKDYTYSLEMNNPSGRSDIEMTGRSNSRYEDDVRVIEFKYFKASEEKKMLSLDSPTDKTIEQVHSYSDIINRTFPQRRVRCYVAHVCTNKHVRVWEV